MEQKLWGSCLPLQIHTNLQMWTQPESAQYVAFDSGQWVLPVLPSTHTQTMSFFTELLLHPLLPSSPFSVRNSSCKIINSRKKRVDYFTHQLHGPSSFHSFRYYCRKIQVSYLLWVILHPEPPNTNSFPHALLWIPPSLKARAISSTQTHDSGNLIFSWLVSLPFVVEKLFLDLDSLSYHPSLSEQPQSTEHTLRMLNLKGKATLLKCICNKILKWDFPVVSVLYIP